MLQFDIRTLSFLVMLTGFLMAGALIVNWAVQRDNRSLRLWAFGFSLSALAGLLIWLKDVIPDFFAVALSNGLLVAGSVLRYWGVSIFVGRPHRLWPGILVVTASLACFMYFTYVHFSTSFRLAIFSLVVAGINFTTAWLLFTRIDKELRQAQTVTAAIFAVYGIVVTFRAVTIFLGTRPATSLDPVSTNVIGYVGDIVFWVGIGVGLLSMTYRRAQVALERANYRLEEAIDATKESEKRLVYALEAGKLAEAELRKARNNLEIRVQERTSELEKAKESVANERRRLYDILETVPVMVCLLTPDHHVAFANRSFRERFGEDNGRHCYDYCFGQKEPCEFCESYKVLETGKPHHWEARSPDGSIIDAYDFPFSHTDGSPLILEMDVDITDRKRAEEALHAASNYNRGLIEASLDPLVTISAEGKITDVNTATEMVTGYPREKLIGSDFVDYFSDPEKARLGYQEVFRDGMVKNYELAIQNEDGTLTPVLYNASLYRDDSGKTVGIFAAARDISERKRAEEKLIRSNELLNEEIAERIRTEKDRDRFFNLSSDMLCFAGFDGYFKQINPAFSKTLGWSEEELLSKQWIEFVHPDDREKTDAAKEQLISGNNLYSFEIDTNVKTAHIAGSGGIPFL